MCFKGVPLLDVQDSGVFRHCPLFHVKQMFRNLAGPESGFFRELFSLKLLLL
jgi:hypothetical protein